MPLFRYFAYGSNMLAERLRKRCKSARVIGITRISGFALAFSKKSKDGSGKATLSRSEQANIHVYGILYEIEAADLAALDRVEGSGYERIENIMVQTETDETKLSATTYMAAPNAVDHSLSPYDWYLDLVLAGARQHRLPVDYIGEIAATPKVVDPALNRPSRLEALELLRWRKTA